MVHSIVFFKTDDFTIITNHQTCYGTQSFFFIIILGFAILTVIENTKNNLLVTFERERKQVKNTTTQQI